MMTISPSRSLSFILITPLILASVFFINSVFAAEPLNCDLDSRLNRLLEIRDTLESSVEKSRLENAARQDLLTAVISCSLSESRDIKNQLDALTDLNLSEDNLRSLYQKRLDDFINYYETQASAFAKISNQAGPVRQLAQEILAWRTREYNPTLNEIIDFIFLFKQQSVINTADSRLLKIKTSLNNIFSLRNEAIDSLLAQATYHIITAKELRQDAYRQFFARHQEYLSPTASSTLPILLESNQLIATSTPPSDPPLRDLIKKSLENIKLAYATFFELSRSVKDFLGL